MKYEVYKYHDLASLIKSSKNFGNSYATSIRFKELYGKLYNMCLYDCNCIKFLRIEVFGLESGNISENVY
jgi:hypothetical protein